MKIKLDVVVFEVSRFVNNAAFLCKLHMQLNNFLRDNNSEFESIVGTLYDDRTIKYRYNTYSNENKSTPNLIGLSEEEWFQMECAWEHPVSMELIRECQIKVKEFLDAEHMILYEENVTTEIEF